MRKSIPGMTAAAMLLVLLAAPAGYAQNESSKVRVGFFFGGTTASDTEETFTIDPLEPNGVSTKFDEGPRVGICGTVDITDRLAVEGMWSTGARSLLIRDNTSTPPDSRAFEVDQQDIYGNVLVFFNAPDQPVRPFVTGGVGFTDFSPTAAAIAQAIDLNGDGFIDDQIAITSESNIGYNFGVGVESKLGEHFGFRTDLRNYITDVPTFGVPIADPGDGTDFYPVSGSINYWVASVGVVVFF